MSKVFTLLAALAVLGSIGAVTVSADAEARCGFRNGQWVSRC